MKRNLCLRPFRRSAVLSATLMALFASMAVQVPVAPASAASPWEYTFVDEFNSGTWPAKWEVAPAGAGQTNYPAATNGQGQLDVGYNASIWNNGDTFQYPKDTRVRVSASILMPDTHVSYAAFWVQQPINEVNNEPRELDVIESFGPDKATPAQICSYLVYPHKGASSNWVVPVHQFFPEGQKPWQWGWVYSAEWVVGGDRVTFSATDAYGNAVYTWQTDVNELRVPDSRGFRLRLSNKPAGTTKPGGTRSNMLVDWVTVQVQRP